MDSRPGDLRSLADPGLVAPAQEVLKAWSCPEVTARWLRRLSGSDAALASGRGVLSALLAAEDPALPWLAAFELEKMLAALALILAWSRRTSPGQPAPSAFAWSALVSRCARFGMWSLKRELADRDLQARDPARYRQVGDWLSEIGSRHRHDVDEVLQRIHTSVLSRGAVLGVEFDYCSVAGASRRLERLGRAAGHLPPTPEHLGAVRVIVPAPSDCYQALGAVHSMGLPEPGQFEDLIAAPRANGFGGLLTNVWLSPRADSLAGGQPVYRLIIQTPLMADLAAQGIAHPALRDLLRRRRRGRLPEVAACLTRLAQSMTGQAAGKVTVFTARGEARQLAAGATVLDLAYRIHSELGDHAVGAEVNGRRADLGSPLPPGARVRIIAGSEHDGRTEADLDGVVEPANRRQIVRLLNRQPVPRGRHAVSAYLRARGLRLEVHALDALVQEVAEHSGLPDAAALYRRVADAARPASPSSDPSERTTAGMVGAEILARRTDHGAELSAAVRPSPAVEWIPALLGGDGATGLRFRLCAACRPSHSAETVGVIRRSMATVHRANCRHLRDRSTVPMRWRRMERTVRAVLSVLAEDRPRLLVELLMKVHALNCGVASVEAGVSEGGLATVRLQLFIRHALVLARVGAELEAVQSVRSVAIEEASLPAPVVERIRRGPRDAVLESELEAAGYGELDRHVLVPPRFVERRRTVRLPYSGNKPAHSPRAFAGRRAEAAWLAAHTVEAGSGGSGGTALVVGAARVGKTSLCLRFLDSFPSEARPRLVRLDLRDLWMMDTDQAFSALQARLGELGGSGAAGVPSAAHIVELVRRGVGRQPRPVVLLLDEFGGPVRGFADGRLGAEFFEVIPQLMDLEIPLSIVLVTVPEAHALLQETGLWARLRMCKDHVLGALKPEEARHMIVQPFGEQGIEWEDQAVAAAAHLTGRLPAYLVSLLQEVAADLNIDVQRTRVRVQDVNAAVAHLLRSDGSFAYLLERWRASPVRQACLAAFLSVGSRGAIDEERWRQAVCRGGASTPAEFNFAVNGLVTEGLLVRSSRSYDFALPMLWRWLRRNLSSQARAGAIGVEL